MRCCLPHETMGLMPSTPNSNDCLKPPSLWSVYKNCAKSTHQLKFKSTMLLDWASSVILDCFLFSLRSFSASLDKIKYPTLGTPFPPLKRSLFTWCQQNAQIFLGPVWMMFCLKFPAQILSAHSRQKCKFCFSSQVFYSVKFCSNPLL